MIDEHNRVCDAVPQCTTRIPIAARGSVLAATRRAKLVINPAPAHTGIVFRRTDLSSAPGIRATADAACWENGQLCLVSGRARVNGVEALLAALYGMNISNAVIDVDGETVPAMNERVEAFVFMLKAAGCLSQPAYRPVLAVPRPLMVQGDTGWVRFYPDDRLRFALLKSGSSARDAWTSADRLVEFSHSVFLTDLCHVAANEIRSRQSQSPNPLAEQNVKRHERHLLSNWKLTRSLAALSLLGADLRGIFVRFGEEDGPDLLLVQRLRDYVIPQFYDGKFVALM